MCNEVGRGGEGVKFGYPASNSFTAEMHSIALHCIASHCTTVETLKHFVAQFHICIVLDQPYAAPIVTSGYLVCARLISPCS